MWNAWHILYAIIFIRPFRAENIPWLEASKKAGTSVLQPREATLSQWAWKRTSAPHEDAARPMPWFQPHETLSRGPSHTVPNLLTQTHRSCEIINGCGFKPLILWHFCSKWKLMQAFGHHQKADHFHQEKALWFSLHTLQVSPMLFSASCYKLPAIHKAIPDSSWPLGILQSLEHMALVSATHLCQVQGILKWTSQGLQVQAEQGMVIELCWVRWAQQCSLRPLCAWRSAQPRWRRSQSACKKLTRSCDWPSLRASKAIAVSFTSDPAQNASPSRGC